MSVSYLYKVPQLADRIRSLRSATHGTDVREKQDRTPSDRSLQTKLTVALEQLAKAKAENIRLARENRHLLAKVLEIP